LVRSSGHRQSKTHTIPNHHLRLYCATGESTNAIHSLKRYTTCGCLTLNLRIPRHRSAKNRGGPHSNGRLYCRRRKLGFQSRNLQQAEQYTSSSCLSPCCLRRLRGVTMTRQILLQHHGLQDLSRCNNLSMKAS